MTLGLEKKNFSFFGKFNPFALNFQGRDLDLNSFFFLNYRPHGKKLSTFQVLSNKRPFFWRSCACAYNLLRIQYPLALPSFILNRKDSLFFRGRNHDGSWLRTRYLLCQGYISWNGIPQPARSSWFQPRKETLTSRKGVLEFSKPENILLSLSGLRSNHASSILIGE